MKAPLLSASALAAGLGLLVTFSLLAQDRQPAKKAGALKEHPSTGWASLHGTVTYNGTPPVPRKINFGASKDAAACHDGATPSELVEQTWLVNKKNKGIANAVIWLQPPPGQYFKIHPDYLAKKSEVTLRQPHGAFIPHVLVYWASSYDKETGEQKASGQIIRLLNDALFNHNVAWFGNEDINPRGSVTLAPGKAKTDMTFAADMERPLDVNCQFHPWMKAKIWALNTPYAARTDEDGNYTIPRVPAGAPLRVVVWHEGVGFAYGKGGKALTFAKGGDYAYNVKMKVGQ